ncbi:MAG TPA: metallopeptidase family protein [Candidatus Limnocylindrales bacterium]|jgi:predicted Zn-dependent protease with MMP-like domain
MPKRRRGCRHPIRPRPPAHHRSFAALVDRALQGIPPPFREALDEVAVVIEDEPTAQQRIDNELAPDDVLYGLYEGVPRTAYGADWVASPNRISLFRLPLEDDFADPDELADQVRRTVIHELAHHLGIDDRRLRELDAD